jgi:PAS domain S-box-containing protein
VDDRIDGVIIIFTTIDRVIESRRLAKKAQRRLQQAIDAFPVFVSFVNRDQIYEYTNQAYRKFLSVAEEEIIGKSIRELIGEESYKFSRHYAEAALEGQQQSFESTLSTSSGQMYVSVTYTPARDVNDQVVGFFVSATDISKMREAKAKLSEAVQIAKQANQAKSDFLAKMSHEIRSPMTAILGFSDILKEQLEDVDNQNCIEIIQKNGYHLLEIINDIPDLSRIESGKFELDSEDFTPAVVLRECHNSLLPRAVDNAVSLDIRTDRKTELPLTGDRRRVKQIVLNLLTNSIKFSAHGLVHLRSAVIKDERFWTITVADTGCGIADEDLPKLFEPFCQVDDSDVRAFEGTGLGLTITSQLVEQMGGSLRVRSKVGVGTVMRVRLPWAKSQVDETSEITAVVLEERMPRLDSVVVLVIDDRRDIRFIVEHLLTDVGAIVYTAESGVAGLDILERCRDSNQPLNFIVTDIQMPEMDGFETARRLRKADYTGPILALSASAMKEDREKAIKAGCNDHIAKPIDKRRLVGKITELLGHHQRLRAEED